MVGHLLEKEAIGVRKGVSDDGGGLLVDEVQADWGRDVGGAAGRGKRTRLTPASAGGFR